MPSSAISTTAAATNGGSGSASRDGGMSGIGAIRKRPSVGISEGKCSFKKQYFLKSLKLCPGPKICVLIGHSFYCLCNQSLLSVILVEWPYLSRN